MKNFSDVLSQAKKMQEKMKETQENLKKIDGEEVHTHDKKNKTFN